MALCHVPHVNCVTSGKSHKLFASDRNAPSYRDETLCWLVVHLKLPKRHTEESPPTV